MPVWTAEPLDLREALRQERHDLLDLLDCLTRSEWLAPTLCPGWRVKDVVLHLLDDDLGWLSRGRDGDLDGLIPPDLDYRDFVVALNQKNQRWVDASQGFSRRLVQELLAWSGEEVAAYHETLVLTDPADVEKPGNHHQFLAAVLCIFVWAFPHQYQPRVDAGTVVNLDFGGDARWHLVRRDHGWDMEDRLAHSPAAALSTDMDTAWRQLTGAPTTPGAVAIGGPAHLTRPLLEVRSIIV